MLPLTLLLLLAPCAGQIFDDAVDQYNDPDVQKLLVRTGTAAALASHFGEKHTLSLDADTLAGGSFLPHTPACNNGGCILDARMAGQLVDWFGNYEWTLKYSGSADGFTNAAFQSKMTNVPTITVVYSRQTSAAAATRGTYIFGGYTAKSWIKGDHTKRCADAGSGGSGTTDACTWWDSCVADASCTGYSQCGCCTAVGGTDCGAACTTGTQTCAAANCVCCADNTCQTVCSHVADPNAAVFTLMANGLHSFNKYASSGDNQEIYACDTYGPSFGASSTAPATTNPPYDETKWALKVDIGNRGGSIGFYGFTGLSDDLWATGDKTDWFVNEIEVYGISAWATDRSLFRYAPTAGSSGGDSAVYLWYRNAITASGGYDSWNLKKRVILPSWADSFMYGFSVAINVNTLIVGRRGNRDVYIHDRDKTDCTQNGATGRCSDRGSYSADTWGLVQTLSWPGSAQNSGYYGNVWSEADCSADLTGCTSQATPTIAVKEWGCSVSLQGRRLVVGAYKSDKGANAATGAAFTYERNQEGEFRYAGTLHSSTTANSHCGKFSNVCLLGSRCAAMRDSACRGTVSAIENKCFAGWDVAIDSDYVISGCYGSSTVAGKVEFYERSPVDGSSASSPWVFIAGRSATTCSNPPSCTTQSSASAAGDFFGYSVGISGSTAIVGSFGVTTNTGAAYIFERGFDSVFDGATANMWRLSKVLVAPDATTNSFFGFSVAVDGSYVLVTSLKENAGKGYLFARNYGGLNNWGHLKDLEQPSTGTGALLYTGNAGAMHSVNFWSDGQGTTVRADGAQLQHNTPYYGDYTISSTSASANFGASAVICGHTVVIGAPFADIANDDIGAVSLWHIHPTWRQTPLRSLEQTLSGGDVAGGDKYGSSVHVTSDNRYAIVGAPNARVSQKIDSGAVYLLARNSNMAFGQYTKLVPDDPADFDYFGESCSCRFSAPCLILSQCSCNSNASAGTSVSSVDLRLQDEEEYALSEIVVGAPGKSHVNYPVFPKQAQASQTQPVSGAVYVFGQQQKYAYTTLAASITSGQVTSTSDETITVTSATDLLGGATIGYISFGMNLNVEVKSVSGNVLTVDGAKIIKAEPAGTRVIGDRYSTHSTKGFTQLEKLTAQSTSCGQGGLDFAGVWNQYSESQAAQTHVSDYTAGATLVQPLYPGDTEICVSSAKDLLGAFHVGGTAPFSQGDATDVIAYVKIDNNPAVAIKNSITTGTCAPSAGNNRWTGTYAGDTLKIVDSSVAYAYPCSGASPCTTTSITTDFVAGVWTAVQLFKAPYFPVTAPYTSCMDGEYVALGRARGGTTTLTTDASGGLASTLVYGYSFETGSSTITVSNALELFEASLWGKIKASASSTRFQLPESASALSGEYIGLSITIDLDGNMGTSSDVETQTISVHASDRYVTVSSAFSASPTSDSIFVISSWQMKPYIASMSNLQITVTAVNFFTNVLTVTGISVPGRPGEQVFQAAPAITKIQLEGSSPDVDDLYVKCTIKIVQGKGAGQIRTITAYNGRTKISTVSPAWIILPDATSEYIITGKPLCVNSCEKDGLGFSITNGRHGGDRHLMAVGAPWADSHSYCKVRSTTTGLCTSHQDPLTEGGRVYLFERHGNSTQNRWRLTQILEAPGSSNALATQGAASAMSILELTASNDHKASHFMHFGWSVAIREDTVFVGVPHSGTQDKGAVYIYERNYHVVERGSVSCATACTTTSFSIGTVTCCDPDNTPRPNALSYLTYMVKINDQTRTISGYSVTSGGEAIVSVSSAFKVAPSAGDAYTIHSGNGNTPGLGNKWGYKQTIVSSSSGASDLFGWSIAVASQTLVVGAPGCDVTFSGLSNALTAAGSVFVYEEGSGSSAEGREMLRWTESQRLVQTSATAVNSNVGTKIGTSVAIDKYSETIIAGGPNQDATAYATDSNFVYTQKQGYLPSAGSLGIWRKQPVQRSTYLSADFVEKATSITVEDASVLFADDSSGTISIGKNQAIQVTAVNTATNVLTVTAETVVFANSRLADGLQKTHVVRKWYWRKDDSYVPSTAVAGGRAGTSVALWDGGVAFYGAPDAETDTACCGSTTNIKTRGGSVHKLIIARLNSSRDYQGDDVESGTIVEVVSTSSNLQFALDNSSSKLEGAYRGYIMMVGSETRRIVHYTGSTRLATVESAFTTTPTAGSSTYYISDYAYTYTIMLNFEHAPAESCRSLLEDGYTQSGYYWLHTRWSNNTGSRDGFIGFCDQETDGGGWLMCYTDDNEVDLAEEHAYSGALPYGRPGYRSDCRNYPFNEIQYILHFGDEDLHSRDDRVIFRAEGRRPVMASDIGWEGEPAADVYGKVAFMADSPDPGPDKSMPYQLLVCASGRSSGFFMSGIQVTANCPTGWKTCSNWCKDRSSEYFRHAYSPKENRNNGFHANFTGVVFRENGHRPGSKKLMSVGIRTAGTNCMAGWEGDGVTCVCPAAVSKHDVVAYWRFEDGIDNHKVFALVEDVSIRTASTFSHDTRLPGAVGSGSMVTTSRNNDLEFLTASPPMYTRWAPRNQSFSILCVPNAFALEFSGSQFVRTTDYAYINSKTFTQFTWEASVYHSSLTNKQTYMSWHNSGGSYSMTFHKNANHQLEFSVKTSSTTIIVTSRIMLNPQTWYHVAVTYDGGVAGQLRLYYLDPYGAAVTGSDCFDDVCLNGALSGTIGMRGKGLGFGVSKLSGTLAGCTVGTTLSAYGGGVCDTGYVGQVCTSAAECGGGLVTGTCKVGAGFAATVTAVDGGGSITDVFITDPGRCDAGHGAVLRLHFLNRFEEFILNVLTTPISRMPVAF